MQGDNPKWDVLYRRCLIDERNCEHQARAQAASGTTIRPGTVSQCAICQARVQPFASAKGIFSFSGTAEHEGAWWCDGGCRRGLTQNAPLYGCSTPDECDWASCVLCVDPYLISTVPRRRNRAGGNDVRVSNRGVSHLDYTLAHPKADDLTAEMGWNPVPSPHEAS